MIDYSEWKRLLDVEDVKETGGIIKRSSSDLYELYETYKSYEPERIAVKARILSRLSDPNYRLSKSCADLLVERCMSVILSCNTLDQLNSATMYAKRVYVRVNMDIKIAHNANYIALIERSIGFAQCKIKTNKGGSHE